MPRHAPLLPLPLPLPSALSVVSIPGTLCAMYALKDKDDSPRLGSTWLQLRLRLQLPFPLFPPWTTRVLHKCSRN